MMKKKVLMPLIVAGIMVASVVSLDSCKKDQIQEDQSAKANYEAAKASFDRAGAPMVEDITLAEKAGAFVICPYCEDTLRPNTYWHWHAFGDKPDNVPDSLINPGEPFGYRDCLVEQAYFCPYSGIAAHDPDLIQFYMDTLGVSYQDADAMTLPRFHGHNISYLLGNNSEQGGSGYHNDFHVGGGVPFWPQFGSGTGPH